MPIDYGRLVSRTWEIISRNRVLWLLGLISAILTGGVSGYSTYAQRSSLTSGTGPELSSTPDLSGLVLISCCVALILGLVFSFIGAAAEAALIRTTDHIERTREQPPFAQAWGLGWQKMGAVWVFNLVFGLIAALIVLIFTVPLIAVGAGSFMAILGSDGTGGSSDAVGSSLVLACLCLCVAILLLIPIVLALSLTRELGLRAVVLENMGVGDAIGHGWRTMRANLGAMLVSFLILLVVGVIVGVVSSLILTPINLLLGLQMFSTATSSAAVPTATIVIAALITWLVSSLVGTVSTTFSSVYWTVLYRHLRQMPNSDLGGGAMMPLTPAGSAPYGGTYGGTYGGGYGTPPPPPYTPPAGSPPPYSPPPAGGAPPYTPGTAPPPYSPPPAGGYPPYTPPGSETRPMGDRPPYPAPGGETGQMPGDEARGPGGSPPTY